MSRKPAKPARASARAQRSSASPTSSIRPPRMTRVVAARALRPRAGGTRTRREVPEIRLSGAWLERIGFPKGAEYLISIEREFRTIILQGSFGKPRRR